MLDEVFLNKLDGFIEICGHEFYTKLNTWCILLRCQILYGKLDKNLWYPTEEPIITHPLLYSLCQKLLV